MAYWLIAVALVVLGFLTGFSIGVFILPVALAMLVLGPFRHRPMAYWPSMTAVIGFVIGYAALAPLYCEARSELGGPITTVCTSLIGIRYSGPGGYNPSLGPATVGGLVTAASTGLLVFGIMWRRRRRASADGESSG